MSTSDSFNLLIKFLYLIYINPTNLITMFFDNSNQVFCF